MAALLFASSLLYRACQAWEPRFAAQEADARPKTTTEILRVAQNDEFGGVR
jgi:hypothetical protein